MEISIDCYEKNGILESVHVFINGYALLEGNRSIAYSLAKDLGQKEVTIVTYGRELPVKSIMHVD